MAGLKLKLNTAPEPKSSKVRCISCISSAAARSSPFQLISHSEHGTKFWPLSKICYNVLRTFIWSCSHSSPAVFTCCQPWLGTSFPNAVAAVVCNYNTFVVLLVFKISFEYGLSNMHCSPRNVKFCHQRQCTLGSPQQYNSHSKHLPGALANSTFFL